MLKYVSNFEYVKICSINHNLKHSDGPGMYFYRKTFDYYHSSQIYRYIGVSRHLTQRVQPGAYPRE